MGVYKNLSVTKCREKYGDVTYLRNFRNIELAAPDIISYKSEHLSENVWLIYSGISVPVEANVSHQELIDSVLAAQEQLARSERDEPRLRS